MSWLRQRKPDPGQVAYAALLAVINQLGTDVERLAHAFDPAIGAVGHVHAALETAGAALSAGDITRAHEAHAAAMKLLETLLDALANGRRTMRDGAALIRNAGALGSR